MNVVPVTVRLDRFPMLPSLNSCADTISNDSSDSITAGPNSTVQVTVIAEPLRIILPLLLVTVTDRGSGTAKKKSILYQITEGLTHSEGSLHGWNLC